MLRIEYDNVTISLSENILGSYFLTHSKAEHDWYPDNFISFRSSERKCFTIKAPNLNDIGRLFHSVANIDNALFPGGKRSENNRIYTYLHYPGQRFTAYHTIKSNYYLNARQNKSDSYHMKFQVRNIDVITRRNKLHDPCIEDWRYYDLHFTQNWMDKVGCRPPHWPLHSKIKEKNDLPICSSSIQMSKFKHQPYTAALESFGPPCKMIERLDYTYREDDIDDDGVHSYFSIDQTFRQTTFTDKMQIRAYTLDDLVGSCGGYIGLFLGYALIQFPQILESAFDTLKRKFHNEKIESMQDLE